MLLPLARKPQHNGLTGLSQERAALRNFDAAEVRNGFRSVELVAFTTFPL